MKKFSSTAMLLTATLVPVISFAASNPEQQLQQLKLEMKQLQQQISQLQGASTTNTASNHLVQVGPLYQDGPMISQLGAIGQEQNILVTRQKMAKMGNQLPLLSIGGLLETDIGYGRNTDLDANYFKKNQSHSHSDAEVTAARLHIMANINDWTTGFFYYDMLANNLRTGKITFGNLNETPFYASIGKSYSYFGNWSGPNIITTDVDTSLFESRSNNAMLGYTQGGFNAQVGLTSPASTVNTPNHNNHAGFLTQAHYTVDLGNNNSAYLGAGYMSDLHGTEVSTLSQAQAADGHTRIPAADLHAGFNVGPFSLNAEYATTLVKVNRFTDTTTASVLTNGKVSALEIDASYTFTIKNYASYVAFGYSQSRNANNLVSYSGDKSAVQNLTSTIPKRMYSLDAGMSLDSRTDVGIEIARMDAYSNTDATVHAYLVGLDMTVHF
ncbi:hypothetical protein PsalN5692_00754 [Piscirickettsia salmonis]|uniref:LbtU family siderophore porin n=1 Tax=Piscirickettsia salmonis TaxID=1238 RepID=UPI0012B770C6|nr:LbtU family siderophore porin [Piscirickettsia salmonis]QGP49324.1 hypothetical protein PsalN5692_00754 [Piscirickettsia salmonis]